MKSLRSVLILFKSLIKLVGLLLLSIIFCFKKIMLQMTAINFFLWFYFHLPMLALSLFSLSLSHTHFFSVSPLSLSFLSLLRSAVIAQRYFLSLACPIVILAFYIHLPFHFLKSRGKNTSTILPKLFHFNKSLLWCQFYKTIFNHVSE